MTEPPLCCPVHDPPGVDPTEGWNCPVDCPDWLTEIERRIEDIETHGNFVRTFFKEGVLYRQVFRNHQAVGEPVRWRRAQRTEEITGGETS